MSKHRYLEFMRAGGVLEGQYHDIVYRALRQNILTMGMLLLDFEGHRHHRSLHRALVISIKWRYK